jgi:hypothetical protein
MSSMFDFLIEQGARRVPHSGRTLYDHLLGTYVLLVKMGVSRETCAAGLYHSVYGTNAFTSVLIRRENRYLVREQIGKVAEDLVYRFCSIDRPTCFLRGEHCDPELIQIEIANLREQGEEDIANRLKNFIGE